ncbi:hypothetical protein JKP88DRAFT_323457, partial [Tribonema minus]
CSICLDAPRQRGALACGHAFCFDCIRDWSQRETTCPLCKQRFTAIQRADSPAAALSEDVTDVTDSDAF